MSVKDEIESDEEIESTDENDSDSRGITPLDFADDKPEVRNIIFLIKCFIRNVSMFYLI